MNKIILSDNTNLESMLKLLNKKTGKKYWAETYNNGISWTMTENTMPIQEDMTRNGFSVFLHGMLFALKEQDNDS